MAPKSLARSLDGLPFNNREEPKLSRTYSLKFVGDWGVANFHRICAWLTQEFCDRAGPGSRTSIWSLRDGGLDGLMQLNDGDVDLAISTPAALLAKPPEQKGILPNAMSHLRALATLPQNDRMVLALDPAYNIKTFEDLRQRKPALRIATAVNDGTNFTGYVANKLMAAHGLPEETVKSWGGSILTRNRPDQCTDMPDEVAYLLTWCLVETRHLLEGQYKHIPPARSPLSYPLIPEKMVKTSLDLHDGARMYYDEMMRSNENGIQKVKGISSF